VIRATHLADIPKLREIERAAADLFRGSPLIDVEAMSVLGESDHIAAIDAGLSFVALADGDLAGFVMGEIHNGHAYLHELDVDPAHQRKAIGTKLVDHFCNALAAAGHTAVWLSTFRDPPWNAPYYRRLGFEDVPRADYAQWMRAIESEQAKFLDLNTRVFMRRAL